MDDCPPGTADTLPSNAQYYGRAVYTHGQGLDRPLDIIRIGYRSGTVSPVIVIPQTDWRGSYDGGAFLVGSATIDWPAKRFESFYLDPSRDAEQPSWVSDIIREQRDGSGLLYKRNRYFDPKSGRFTQEDPIGIAGGLNLYGFGEGDPVNNSDPFGLCTREKQDDCTLKDLWNNFRVGLGAAGGSGALDSGPGYNTGVALGLIGQMVGLRAPVGAVQRGVSWAGPVSNSVPGRMARVIAGEGPYTTLGRAEDVDVFVTAPRDIAGLNASQITTRVAIPQANVVTVVEFPTPQVGVASPVNRVNPGFVGGGRTGGGAREFVVPNGPVPPGATTRIVH
jgi:RHS repeat-associated protein